MKNEKKINEKRKYEHRKFLTPLTLLGELSEFFG